MIDLSDFGTDDRLAPPRLQKYKRVRVAGTDQTAGWVGPMPNRGVLGFVKASDESDRLYDPDGHALNDSVLGTVDAYGAQRVLVVEFDTKTVWEWPRREWSESVPAKITRGQGDQTYAPLEHAHEWDDHADLLWIDEDVDVSEGWRSSNDWERGDDPEGKA